MGLAFLITTDNLQLLSERKVLKETEYAALLDATAVVEVAHKEAGRIVEQAQTQAQQSQRHGYERGLEQARAEYAAKLVDDALAAQRQLRVLRGAMAHIVVKALGQFLADASPQVLFETALARVDNLVRNEPFLTMRVAPAQESVVQQVLSRLRQEAGWTMPVAVQADPALQPGECVVQTPSGSIDIGLAAQLDAFRRAVERGAAGHGQADAGSAVQGDR